MKKVAVAIDKWKLSIFKRHLDGGGYKYDELPGLTPEMLILKVSTPTIAQLQPVVEAAQAEARNHG